MEKLFHLKEHGTTVRREIIAGLTTFLAMAYILAVNPSILGNVMNAGGVFVATALASALATFIMGLWANYPIALSAGMGLNAYFAFTVCLGQLQGDPNAFRVCLTAVFTEGVVFILMSLFKFREMIVNSIPANLKYGISAGIGRCGGVSFVDQNCLAGISAGCCRIRCGRCGCRFCRGCCCCGCSRLLHGSASGVVSVIICHIGRGTVIICIGRAAACAAAGCIVSGFFVFGFIF